MTDQRSSTPEGSPASRGGTPRVEPTLLALVAPALAVLSVFLVAPMLGLVRISLIPGDISIDASGLSLHHYVEFFRSNYYLAVLGETLLFGAATALLCLIFGFPIGYSLARMPANRRRLRYIIVLLPLTLSLVVIVFGWLVILGRDGVLNEIMVGLGLWDGPHRLLFNRGAVLVVLVQQFLPFMILSIMSVVSQIDPTLEQASESLRAGRLRTYRKVILPMAMPGIVSGCTLVFVLTISAFITPKLLGGAGTQMLGAVIYDQVMTAFNWPKAAAMAFVLLIVGLGVSNLVNRLLLPQMKGRAHAK